MTLQRRSFWAQRKLATISWFGLIATIVHFGWSSHTRPTIENMKISIIMCLLFLTLASFNSTSRHPFTSIGNLPAIGRGLGMTLCCFFIFILCNNWDDAREIISIIENKPTAAELKAYLFLSNL